MKRFISAIAMMAIAVAMMAAPATAAGNNTAVVVFKGTALVCSSNPGANADCGGSNAGLQFPGIAPLNTTGSWSFGSGSLNLPNPASVVDGALPTCLVTGVVGGSPVAGAACSLNASGLLSPIVGGIGASCGVSNGNGGSGTISAAAGSLSASNVGWTTSAGGTLPVTGTYSGTPGGVLVGVVQAQGGDQCASADGSATFRVVGVLVGVETV